MRNGMLALLAVLALTSSGCSKRGDSIVGPGGPANGVFPRGVFTCPANPEGMVYLRKGWGPFSQSVLAIACTAELAFYTATGTSPGILQTLGLFQYVALGPLYGLAFYEQPHRQLERSANLDGVLAFGGGSSYHQVWDTATQSFGMTEIVSLNRAVLDGSSFGNDPEGEGVVWTGNLGYTVRSCCSEDQSVGLPVSPASVYRQTSSGPVLIAMNGSPGTLLVDQPDAAAPTPVGNTGVDPRRVRALPPIGVVTNFGSDDLTVFTWDGVSMSPQLVGQVPVGDGPVGVDLIQVGANVAVVSTGYNDDTYTVTVLDPSGAVVSTTTRPVPAGVTNPGHAIFAQEDGEIVIIMTGNTSSSFAIVDSGL